MTIEELRVWQDTRALSDAHIVEVRDDGFTMAHTDAERDSGEPLAECIFHRFLAELDEAPADPGIYRVESGGEFFPLERY